MILTEDMVKYTKYGPLRRQNIQPKQGKYSRLNSFEGLWMGHQPITYPCKAFSKKSNEGKYHRGSGDKNKPEHKKLYGFC